MFIASLARVDFARDFDGERIDQHKQHAVPLVRVIPPLMHRAALDTHVPPLQRDAFARVHHHLHLAFDDDPVVQALGAVHRGVRARRAVHHAQHRAIGEGKRQDRLLLGQDVVVLDVDGERARRPHRVVPGHVVVDLRPRALVHSMDDPLAVRVVAGDDPLRLAVCIGVCHF